MKHAVFNTGAQTGTGYAIAEKFAANGYDVFLTSRSGEKAAAAAEKLAATYGIFARGYECGIRNEQQIIDIFNDIDQTGRTVRTIILCAADLGFGSDPSKGLDFFSQDVAEFQQVFETNLVWNFMLVRQAALRMKEHNGGAVVFLSSNTAYRAIPNRMAYCASKGGINAMSKAMAIDLGPYGIRSNAILPGTIKTERWQRMGSSQIVSGQLTPIGDITDFEDIANACWYLGTDLSKNVTGTELILDGGMSCQLYPQKLNELLRR